MAFRKVCTDWVAKAGSVAMWQVRAFIYGMRGRDCDGLRERRVPQGYSWLTPPDVSWDLVVCVYPDGLCDLDFAHPVSRRFWSEDHDFFALPSDDRSVMNREWFKTMGFEILDMQPAMQVIVSEKRTSHLKPV